MGSCTSMGVFAFQRSRDEKQNTRDISLYIRYLRMQVWKEVMWDGPLPSVPLGPVKCSPANEEHRCRWRWPSGGAQARLHQGDQILGHIGSAGK